MSKTRPSLDGTNQPTCPRLYLPWNHCRGSNQPIMTNYAKQTQIAECLNKRKLSFNKGLLR